MDTAIKKRRKINVWDIMLMGILGIWALAILLPVINVVAVSFTSNTEYYERPLMLFPYEPTLKNYMDLFDDGRVLIGYRTTLLLVCIGVPLNLFLTTSFAYGMSRRGYPGRKIIFYLVLLTMLFNGGIIPMYMLMMNLHLTDTLGSVILANGINTFYMIIMRNFFAGMPDALIESAKIDGAGEWRILFRIILPLSMPIIATISLFYTVDRWNEWYNAMIFIKSPELQPLQLVLRSIVLESQMMDTISETGVATIDKDRFVSGLKMAAVVVTMLPVMCVFPFLQKYFVKGVLVGAIKS